MRWVWHVVRMGESRGVYRDLVGKRGGKRPLGRPRHRWEDNIKMDLEEVRCGERQDMYILEYALCWPRVEVGNFRKKRNEVCCLLEMSSLVDDVTVCSVLRCAWDAKPCL